VEVKKAPDGQVEVALESKQLLVIFFVIVALCGVFFSLGYIVGHNTLASVTRITQSEPGAGAPDKPSPMPPAPAVQQEPENPAPAGPNSDQPAPAPAAAPAPDLNFYQSVEEKSPDARLSPAEVPHTVAPRAPATERPRAEPDPGIVLQVSALTHREDANTLIALLKGRRLPVTVSSSSTDSLFHVLVGPYKNLKDAEHAKQSLEKDGFRPIIKR
jgi:DedD protein